MADTNDFDMDEVAREMLLAYYKARINEISGKNNKNASTGRRKYKTNKNSIARIARDFKKNRNFN